MNSISIKDKHDIESVRKIIDLGYPENKKYLDELLSWTMDANWPIAPEIFGYFIELGIDEVERVLNCSGVDCDWRYDILMHIVSFYNPKCLNKCKQRLAYWAGLAGSCESEILALEILVKNELIPKEEVIVLASGNVKAYKSYIDLIEDLLKS